MVGEPTPVIEARQLVKEYETGRTRQRALVGVSLPVPQGCFISIMGPSGSGKSTLLHLLGGLDDPTSGDVIFEGTPISQLPEKDRTLLRRRRIRGCLPLRGPPHLAAAQEGAPPAAPPPQRRGFQPLHPGPRPWGARHRPPPRRDRGREAARLPGTAGPLPRTGRPDRERRP